MAPARQSATNSSKWIRLMTSRSQLSGAMPPISYSRCSAGCGVRYACGASKASMKSPSARCTPHRRGHNLVSAQPRVVTKSSADARVRRTPRQRRFVHGLILTRPHSLRRRHCRPAYDRELLNRGSGEPLPTRRRRKDQGSVSSNTAAPQIDTGAVLDRGRARSRHSASAKLVTPSTHSPPAHRKAVKPRSTAGKAVAACGGSKLACIAPRARRAISSFGRMSRPFSAKFAMRLFTIARAADTCARQPVGRECVAM